ncbi:hypothetical protein [Candidatus Spongiihabitans sp.]|uniref:hypothetical protein n=1 Tax=Candidatus Spongiihabitans sp. TaxID=3101308 RepID=UPI003C7039F3
MSKPIDIVAELKEIEYVTKLSASLEIFEMNKFLNGNLSSKSRFILKTASDEYAVSQWVSPKRTRSYPFARVYDTLNKKNRVTLIPFCKDEGADGDRDFIQWDTVSLMSLFNVYVIVGYYTTAKKNIRPKQIHKNKITNQSLDHCYVGGQLKELQNYHSSALHWNLKQMEQLFDVAECALVAYRKISCKTGVRLHGEDGIKKRITIAKQDASKFRDISRQLAQQAQIREALINQPKEKTGGNKAIITLKNLLGGLYYWTADECFIAHGRVFLIEKKHSKTKVLPSQYDIKDAFIKMALFSNISSLKYNNVTMPYYAVVGLTSGTVRGSLHSEMSSTELNHFFSTNKAKEKDKKLILSAIDEAQSNDFGLFIVNSEDAVAKQGHILQELVK